MYTHNKNNNKNTIFGPCVAQHSLIDNDKYVVKTTESEKKWCANFETREGQVT